MSLPRRLLTEMLGTALPLAVVIGSGIMAERLAAGNLAIALIANTLATVRGLYVLIEVFGPVGGAHFNPAVSALMTLRGELAWTALLPYVGVQLLEAMLGAWLANAMFELPVLQASAHLRGGTGQWLAEIAATAGLLVVILRAPPGRASSVVAKAFMESDAEGRMKPSACYDRVVDVMEELLKFTLLTRDVADQLMDRYIERKESAEALMQRVNQRAI